MAIEDVGKRFYVMLGTGERGFITIRLHFCRILSSACIPQMNMV